jgi:hypothetical protein
MPICDQATIDANKKIAEQINPNRNYIGFLVVITNVDVGLGKVAFAFYEDRNKTYSVDWGDLTQMWPMCPTTFPTTLPRANDQGVLYLSIDYLQFHRLSIAPPKWPKVG